MPKLKVCGLTRIDEVDALDGLVDYLGFIVAPERVTHRILEPRKALELASTVSRSKPVLVLYGFEIDDAIDMVRKLDAFSVVQYHWPEKPRQLLRLHRALSEIGVKLAPVVFYGIGGWSPLHPMFYSRLSSVTEYLLVDAPKSSGVRYEGGLRVPPEAVQQARRFVSRVGVAGGITPRNVCLVAQDAWLIDVSSGVERKGRKDPQLVEELVKQLQGCKSGE